MECKKCKSTSSVTLRKNDSYCEDCFINNVNHKFRACIGKNKILTLNEKVLVCFSGGAASTTLLDLIHNGISMDSHKKLRILPTFLHLLDANTYSLSVAENVVKQCIKHNFHVYVIHISQYMQANIEFSSPNMIPPVKTGTADQFNKMVCSIPTSACNDFLIKIKRDLFIKSAKELGCRFIFTAETSTTLAINLLSNLTLGRGSQVENDVGFCDARDENVKILRPIRDVTQEELNNYIKIKNLNPVNVIKRQEMSVQTVITEFVSDLQKNFPSTISTVCKTADKISVCNNSEKRRKCIICESNIGMVRFKLTAFEATNISRAISYRSYNINDFSNKTRDSQITEDENIKKSLFPFVHKYLCYACSRNYSETDKLMMPNRVQKMLDNDQ